MLARWYDSNNGAIGAVGFDTLDPMTSLAILVCPAQICRGVGGDRRVGRGVASFIDN